MGDRAWERLQKKKGFRLFRNVTILFTILIFFLAIILIGVGSAAIEVLATYQSILRVTIPAGIIVVGVFLMILTVFGFVGVFKKSSKIFTWYLLLLLFLIIIQFGIGGGAYSYRNSIPSKMRQIWDNFSNSDRNRLQTQFNCCGYTNYTDLPGSNCFTNGTNSTSGNTTGSTTGYFSTGSTGTTGPVNTTGSTGSTGTTGPVNTTGSTGSTGTTGPVNTTGSTGTTGTTGTTGSTGSVTTGARKREEGEGFQEFGEFTLERSAVNGTLLPGCGYKLMSSLQNQLTVVATVGIIFAVLQLAAFIFGGVLFLWLRLTKQFSQLDEEY